eukprot:3043367-Prymnesium_polylepis.1
MSCGDIDWTLVTGHGSGINLQLSLNYRTSPTPRPRAILQEHNTLSHPATTYIGNTSAQPSP